MTGTSRALLRADLRGFPRAYLRACRRGWIPVLVASFSLAGLACAPADESTDRPLSIVMVVADTLRADALGYRGLGPGITPAIDRLAGESLAFSNAYSTAPWTKPAVASLLTGVVASRHGVTNHEGVFRRAESANGARFETDVVPSEYETIAEQLKAHGYRTAAFVSNEWLKRGYGYEQGFDHYEDDIPASRLGGTFAAADEWLAHQAPDVPVFLYIHAMEAHGPYDAPEPLVEQARTAPLGKSRMLSNEEFEAIPAYLRSSPWAAEPSARDLQEWRARYVAGVIALDRGLGTFLERLEARGRAGSTAVLFTSDHGEEFLEHGGFDHGRTLYDELTRVPLMLRVPGIEPREVASVVSLIAVHPTLVDLASRSNEAQVDAAPDGLLAFAGAGRPEAEGAAQMGATKWNPNLHALRAGRHKLIIDSETRGGLLYDLVADPAERASVATQAPEHATRLAKQLFEALETDRTLAAKPTAAPMDEAQLKALAALGYVED